MTGVCQGLSASDELKSLALNDCHIHPFSSVTRCSGREKVLAGSGGSA